jgi:cytochrome P450
VSDGATGVNRCPVASFANMEMDVALRVLLREFRSAPTDAPGGTPYQPRCGVDAVSERTGGRLPAGEFGVE